MDDGQDFVQIGENKFISKTTLLLHLKTYNLYYEGQNLQLRNREEEGELIVEGLLNISWGLRRPIRLQMQDDNESSPRPLPHPGIQAATWAHKVRRAPSKPRLPLK
ncbi:hypothetical protein AAFF_G00012540 [Aldrovandia affinis]|uniref:Ras association domain-containing protein 2 n=1 Tax=Aldrovandia affinis TaxID=143900 RepID=A0AAD7S6L5_9TELE|nr:hypothetical protein AAFF_G00012540 [Aldrovandia affinis]